MSIQGFKDITKPLTKEENALIPVLIAGFRHHVGIQSIISSKEIIRRLSEKGYKITGPRLRKIINHIRKNAIAPICSNSQGYWWSVDRKEIYEEIKSLEERAAGILVAAAGLKKYMAVLNEKNIQEEMF